MRGLFLFTCLYLLFSCSDNDAESSLNLVESNVKLLCDSIYTPIVDVVGIDIDELKWDVDNDFSISVGNTGIINANRVGETLLKVKDNATGLQDSCVIEVLPKYSTYIEIPLEFGCTMEEFKVKVNNYSEYVLLNESKQLGFIFFNYTGENISTVKCDFKNDGLVSVSMNILKPENIDNFLNERYKLESSTGEGPTTHLYKNKEEDILVTYVEQYPTGSTITYTSIEK